MWFNCRVVVAAGGCWLMAVSVEAQWVQCAEVLEQLQDLTSDARELSLDVASMESQIVIRRAEYLRCQQSFDRDRLSAQIAGATPNVISGDTCRDQEMLYQSSGLQYTAALSRARSAFEGLAVAVQTVEASCQFPLAAYAPATTPQVEQRSPACQAFLADRPGAPLLTLRILCRSEMSEEACSACLGAPPNEP